MTKIALQIANHSKPAPSVQRKSNAKSVSLPVRENFFSTMPSIQRKSNNSFNWMADNELIKSKSSSVTVQPSKQSIVQPKLAAVSVAPVQAKATNVSLQTKLETGRADDHFEREADSVAERVVSMPEPAQVHSKISTTVAQRFLQRSATSTSSFVQRSHGVSISLVNNYTNTTQLSVQKQDTNPSRAGPVNNTTLQNIEGKLNSSSGRGSPLSPEVRTFYESRMDADFSNVRVHTDRDAVQMNNHLGSYAFAHKNNIYFNTNQYNPTSTAGKKLLAHELTHVVQQGAAVRKKSMNISSAPVSIQGFGMQDVREYLNDLCRNIPGYTLVTVIIGYNFVLGQSVERNAINLFDGFLGLMGPIGNAIFLALQKSGVLQKAGDWLTNQLNSLGITKQKLLEAFDKAIDTISWTDVFNWKGAVKRTVGFFTPFFSGAAAFASRVFDQVVQFIKQTILKPLGDFAQTLPGYPLLCVIMGRNPITGEIVPRTTENFVHGFMSLMPGGEEKWQQMKQSKAIPKAFEWLNQQVTARNLTWARISGTFSQAWDSLSPTDVLHPIDTINRVAGIFKPLVADIVGFAISALEKMLEFIFEVVMGAGGARVLAILKKAKGTFVTVINNPVGFLTNLVGAVKQGLGQFKDRILVHLKNGVIEWLTGGLTGAGIQLPEQWDLQGILFFVMQILGITYSRIRGKLVTMIGEKPVQVLEGGLEIVKLLVTKGPMAAWEKILESIGNLKDMVLNGIREWIQKQIVIAAITKLATMFNPVGAVIQAILATYNTIMFFIERINQIMTLVESVVDSVSAIAAGSIGSAANYIEKSMAKAIPVILSFLGRLIGIGDIADPIRKVIQTIQQKVDAALDKVVEWIKKAATGLIEKGKEVVGNIFQWWKNKKALKTKDGVAHTLFFEGDGASARLMIATTPMSLKDYLAKIKKDNSLKDADIQKPTATVAEIEKKKAEKVADNQATKQANDISELMAKLATELADLPLEVSGANSGPVFGGLYNNAFGTSVVVAYQQAPFDRGSIPTPPDILAFDKINARKHDKGSYYVKGHLLNENLGGSGKIWSNLTPINRDANKDHQINFEDKVKLAVNGTTSADVETSKLSKKGIMKGFSVIAVYGQKNSSVLAELNKEDRDSLPTGVKPEWDLDVLKDILEGEKHVPNSLKCSAKIQKRGSSDFETVNHVVTNDIKYDDMGAYQLGLMPKPHITIASLLDPKATTPDQMAASFNSIKGIGKVRAEAIYKVFRAKGKISNGKAEIGIGLLALNNLNPDKYITSGERKI